MLPIDSMILYPSSRYGGRAWIRSVLYMSAVVAVRRNPILKEFYERLRAKGKPAKQALTARMRIWSLFFNALPGGTR